MRRPKTTRAPQPRCRLAFESLESRDLLAADAAAEWSMDWDAAAFGDAAGVVGDSWVFDESWAADDSWLLDDALVSEDTWVSDAGWGYDDSWYDDAWYEDDAWVQDVISEVAAVDTGAADIDAILQDEVVDVVGPVEPADATTIEIVTAPAPDVPVGSPVVAFPPPIEAVDLPVVQCLPSIDDVLPDGVRDDTDTLVVIRPDCDIPEPMIDESYGPSGEGRDDGEIVVIAWLPAESDPEVEATTGQEAEFAGGIEVEITGDTSEESWVVDTTAVDGGVRDTTVVVVQSAVPRVDVASLHVSAQVAPAAVVPGRVRAWAAFFFPGLGQTVGSPDAASAALHETGRPGSGRPRIRLPFRPVV